MEVHAHTHTARKKWTHYLWEFLMLFLAVFCGFFAEYQLEHKIERDREKKYIQTFIEDLKTDTASINRNLVFQQSKKEQLDSFSMMLRAQKIKGYENELYYLARLMVRTRRFQNNDRTITQLKNSGSLRLIRNEEAADSMIAYQKLVETILMNIDDERVERRAADPYLEKMFNAFVFDSMLDESNVIHKPTGNPALRSYDTSLQLDIAYRIHQLKGSNVILLTRLELLKQKAINIIDFLRKEYHLK